MDLHPGNLSVAHLERDGSLGLALQPPFDVAASERPAVHRHELEVLRGELEHRLEVTGVQGLDAGLGQLTRAALLHLVQLCPINSTRY
jgi:hypothetical protein